MTLKDIQLNNVHDIEIIDNDLAIVSGLNATVQSIRQRYWLFQSEWFLDETAGVPYLQQIFVKGVRLAVVRNILLRVLASTEGVASVRRFTVTPEANRGVFVSFEAQGTGESDIIQTELSVGA